MISILKRHSFLILVIERIIGFRYSVNIFNLVSLSYWALKYLVFNFGGCFGKLLPPWPLNMLLLLLVYISKYPSSYLPFTTLFCLEPML